MKSGPPTKEIFVIITAKYSLNITRVVKLSNGQGAGRYVGLGKKKFVDNFGRHIS